MNNIFQKNINALAQKNETLARELLTHIPTDVPELKQENGAYNLFYKNQYLHNPINPLGEAQGIFADGGGAVSGGRIQRRQMGEHDVSVCRSGGAVWLV